MYIILYVYTKIIYPHSNTFMPMQYHIIFASYKLNKQFKLPVSNLSRSKTKLDSMHLSYVKLTLVTDYHVCADINLKP